ncbi:hypothetical protein NQZ68_003559 [Dissostichus eleginoides]|nr:hypothetical protein NQZ68_003559 [Dissostichus eleginoides]
MILFLSAPSAVTFDICGSSESSSTDCQGREGFFTNVFHLCSKTMGKAGSKVLRETSEDGVPDQPPPPPPADPDPDPVPVPAPASVKFEGLTKTNKMKVKWSDLGLAFFIVLSLVMTGCFFWQYQMPKLLPGEAL